MMTAGVKLQDGSYSTVIGGTTINQLGKYYRREWSGGDRPKVTPTYTPRAFEFYRVPLPDLPKRIVGYRWVTKRLSGGSTFRWKVAIWADAKTGRSQLRVRKAQKPPKQKKPRKSLPELHPYDMNVVEWQSGLSETVVEYLGYPYTPHTDRFPCSGWALGLPGYTNDWDSNDDLKTLLKLRSAMNGSDFNVGVFLAESAQSVRMIFDAASRITKCVTFLKKGNPFAAWDALRTTRPRPKSVSTKKSAADNWVEMQYGWKPLIDDAESGAQFIAHLVVNPVVTRFRVSKKKAFMPTSTPIQWGTVSAVRRRQIVAYITQVDRPELSGLTDVASIAWEKTPWSFVADWFIPIGNFLASASLARAVTGSFVITDTLEYQAASPHVSGLYDNTRSTTTCDFSYKSKSVTRRIYGVLPVPLPSVKPIGKAATWLHAANAVALLTQRLR